MQKPSSSSAPDAIEAPLHWVTRAQAAAMLERSERAVIALCRKGILREIRKGYGYAVCLEDLRAELARREADPYQRTLTARRRYYLNREVS